VPVGAIEYWAARLEEHRISHRAPVDRFGEQAISFSDPDGLGLELVSTATVSADRVFAGGPVPLAHAIHGFHNATLTAAGYERTAALLTETMGFRLVQQEGNRHRYATGAGGAGAIADVLCAPEEQPGRVAVGTVHHLAWRTPDDQQQRAWREELARLAYDVTPVIDRQYFRSIYYREPGGVLFEIATDPPGFAIDESPEELGSKLQLPRWLEPAREELQAILPPLHLPERARGAQR
jgi:catechol 2,3-dioxygenase-like lactoylglutathione lyase family enzyme